MKPGILFFLMISSVFTHAQKQSPYAKFGKIGVEDLQRKVYSVDSSANAVVLSDIGEAYLEGNSRGWFSVVNKRHKVVHILNKNGYDEAKVEITLYQDTDAEEKVENLKAITYNLENGKRVETKLDKASIFKEKVSKNRCLLKFTFPNIREGSIIEYEYKVKSDYINTLDPWFFQGSSPVLWTEYNFSMPDFFTYNLQYRGYQPITINEKEESRQQFNIYNTRTNERRDPISFGANSTNFRWGMQNVPRMIEESFTSSLKNHLARIEIQLASQGYPLEVRDFRTNWTALAKELLESEYFGYHLRTSPGSISDEVKPIVASYTQDLDKARRIFYYVRDNFTTTGNNGYFIQNAPKTLMKTKKGSVAEINMLLIAMLHAADLKAEPVILSTRSHGYASEASPMTTNFNYLVVRFKDGNRNFYLDASDNYLGFGRLHPFCYNGHGRVITETAPPVYLVADSLREAKLTQLIFTNNDEGKWIGAMQQTLGYQESYVMRHRIREKGTEAFFQDIAKNFGADITIGTSGIDSLKKYDFPIKLSYDFKVNLQDEDIIYINPLFGEVQKTNPFKAATRNYPVEMPYTSSETIVVNMEVPKGYVIDEIPKPAVVKFDEEGKTFFEYRISTSGDMITVRSRVVVDKAFFMPGDYEVLREFFNFIVTKQNEQIVFKKKK